MLLLVNTAQHIQGINQHLNKQPMHMQGIVRKPIHVTSEPDNLTTYSNEASHTVAM